MALAAFLITSVVGSTLSAWARRQTQEARRQRRETEQLYDLSQRFLNAGDSLGLCKEIPADIVDAFSARAAALLLTEGQTIFYSPGGSHQIEAGDLKASLDYRDVRLVAEQRLCFVPLRLGINVIGSIGIAEMSLSQATLEALGSLVTIAIERARAIRGADLRQSGKPDSGGSPMALDPRRVKALFLDSAGGGSRDWPDPPGDPARTGSGPAMSGGGAQT